MLNEIMVLLYMITEWLDWMKPIPPMSAARLNTWSHFSHTRLQLSNTRRSTRMNSSQNISSCTAPSDVRCGPCWCKQHTLGQQAAMLLVLRLPRLRICSTYALQGKVASLCFNRVPLKTHTAPLTRQYSTKSHPSTTAHINAYVLEN